MHKLVISVLLCCSTSLFAAILKAPDELVILAVNGQQLEKSWFDSANEVALSQGKNLIKLKYLDLFEEDYDQHEIVESEPFWLAIEVGDTEKALQLVFNKPDSVAAARAFVGAPTKELTLEGSQQRLAIFDVKPSQTMGQIDSNHALETNESFLSTTEQKTQLGNAPNALNMLEFWWQQASIEQKKAFLKQIDK